MTIPSGDVNPRKLGSSTPSTFGWSPARKHFDGNLRYLMIYMRSMRVNTA
jgi:hypothetical protein